MGHGINTTDTRRICKASANLIITTDIVWNSIRNGLNTSVSVYHVKHIGMWGVHANANNPYKQTLSNPTN